MSNDRSAPAMESYMRDAQGRVVSESYDGKTYRGSAKVLADLDQVFTRDTTPAVAQVH